jgi:hypothetical protein
MLGPDAPCDHVAALAAPGRHATAHFHGSRHPVIASLEPGETWGWCYVDAVEFDAGYEPRARIAG